ncbi:MAG: hypothetical protein V2I65_16360 [Paracoccaceae bacterium]|jgi:uncharacterized membrane protein YgcG|nr:hypothetical protein [Paracoccaceae bacterium]
MFRRTIAFAFLFLTVAAGPLAAQGVSQDQIVSQLRDQGYNQIRISQTFLGRTRIVALSDDHRREIVFNPATGVIMRDYWVVLGRDDDDDDDSSDRIVDPGFNDDDDDDGGGSSGSSASSGSSDNDDDDDDGGGGSSGSSGGSDDNDDDDD